MTLINNQEGNLRETVKALRSNRQYGRSAEDGRNLRRHYIERHNFLHRVSAYINTAIFVGGAAGFSVAFGVSDGIDGALDARTDSSLGLAIGSLIAIPSILAMSFSSLCGVRQVLKRNLSELFGPSLDYQI